MRPAFDGIAQSPPARGLQPPVPTDRPWHRVSPQVAFEGTHGRVNFQFHGSPSEGYTVNTLNQPALGMGRGVMTAGQVTPDGALVSTRTFARDDYTKCEARGLTHSGRQPAASTVRPLTARHRACSPSGARCSLAILLRWRTALRAQTRCKPRRTVRSLLMRSGHWRPVSAAPLATTRWRTARAARRMRVRRASLARTSPRPAMGDASRVRMAFTATRPPRAARSYARLARTQARHRMW